MYQYYVLFRFKYGVPVFPVAVYLQGGKGLAAEQYRDVLFGEEQLRFRFKTLALAQLDAEEYVATGNPIAASLAALMKRDHLADRLTLRALMMQ